jgi:hypothetical protein
MSKQNYEKERGLLSAKQNKIIKTNKERKYNK